MKTIVNNIALEYMDEGQGPVLFFMHGWQDNLSTFEAIKNQLVAKYRVIRLDLPGFGYSDTPVTAWNLDNYIDCVSAFLQKMEVSPRAIVSHSFGGRITIKGIAIGKIKTEKVVLIASAGLSKRFTIKNLAIKIISKVVGVALRIPGISFWRDRVRNTFYKVIKSDYINAGALQNIFLNIIKEDLAKFAPQLQNETLLIWGDKDTATPIADGKRLAKLIPNSRLEILHGSSHFVHREKSEEVAKLILDFVC